MATSMENPRYKQEDEYDYDEYYEGYPEPGLTSVGLPPAQLALIIGVNAVISLVISISVVLLAGRQSTPVEVPVLAGENGQATGVEVGGDSLDELAAPDESIQGELSPESTPVESVNYVVQDGDTLSSIADKFSVPLFDLMLANGLTDENFIQSGQSLVIPVGGLPTATPTFTPQPIPTETPLPFDPPTPLPADAAVPKEPAATVGPSPTPTETPTITPTPLPTSTPPAVDEINVVVSEINGAGDLSRETITILNQGPGTSLKNWKLEGSPLAIFEFPDIFLFSGGSIRVHTASGENTASDLYLGQSEPAWEPGGVIILTDAQNSEISRFNIPDDGE